MSNVFHVIRYRHFMSSPNLCTCVFIQQITWRESCKLTLQFMLLKLVKWYKIKHSVELTSTDLKWLNFFKRNCSSSCYLLHVHNTCTEHANHTMFCQSNQMHFNHLLCTPIYMAVRPMSSCPVHWAIHVNERNKNSNSETIYQFLNWLFQRFLFPDWLLCQPIHSILLNNKPVSGFIIHQWGDMDNNRRKESFTTSYGRLHL